MKFFHSIRWRLQLWHGLLLALVLAGFGYSAWKLEQTSRMKHLDQSLDQRVQMVLTALRREMGAADRMPDRPPRLPRQLELRLLPHETHLFDNPQSGSHYYIIWLPDGRMAGRSGLAPDVDQPERRESPRYTRTRNFDRESIHFTPPGECILVGCDMREDMAALNRFAWLLIGAGGAVFLLGLAGGWWITSRSLRPVTDISATAARISSGDLSQRIPTSHSSSELDQLVETLNTTFARLDAVFSQQARFTADASHELRTPVTVILTHAQNGLAIQCPVEEHREALEACQRSAQRMRRLIESLLLLARIETGVDAARHESCDLHSMVLENMELLKTMAQEHRVTFSTRLEPAACEGMADQLNQVISNLLNNAIYYNHPGGNVTIRTFTENGGVILVVEDNGQGIDEKDLPHIFERFYRVDKARSTASGRTGLGLAIARAIVESHGGSIQAASQPGQGSTFTVRFPALKTSAPATCVD